MEDAKKKEEEVKGPQDVDGRARMAGILEGGVADGMLALGELMAQTQEEEAERAAAAARPAAKAAFTPADIGGAPPGAGPGTGAPAAPAGDPKAIWTEDEVVEVPEDDVDDGRRAPAYDFRYKQAVGTEVGAAAAGNALRGRAEGFGGRGAPDSAGGGRSLPRAPPHRQLPAGAFRERRKGGSRRPPPGSRAASD